jgi:hypothetical protein
MSKQRKSMRISPEWTRARRAAAAIVAATTGGAAPLQGCDRPGTVAPPAASGAPSASPPPAASAPPRAAHAGPTGGVSGVVTATGDRAPARGDLGRIAPECLQARETYEPLFREGMLRSLGDVLVTVTDYEGWVPPASDSVQIVARGCAFPARTIGLTLGQRIRIKSGDGISYVPELQGAGAPAAMVAIPGGDWVDLHASKPGLYRLIDTMHPHMTADVFVVKYSTLAVTGLDGRFAIERVPVGPATVTALLPATRQKAEKKVVVEAGKTLELSFEIPFDAKRHAAPASGAPAPSAR